jgi:hypothetical protein
VNRKVVVKYFRLLVIGLFTFTSVYAQDDTEGHVSCSAIPQELESMLLAGSLVLVGEMHGTNEMPQAFSDIVCTSLKTGIQVNIGLELLPKNQKSINAFINSDGSQAEILKMVSTGHWVDDWDDGRDSLAILGLLEDIRTWKSAKLNFSLFYFDSTQEHRDREMFKLTTSHIEPRSINLIFTGNLHAKKSHSMFRGNVHHTMGGFLSENKIPFKSIYLNHSGGSTFMCAPDCRVFNMGSISQLDQHEIFKKNNLKSPYDFEWNIGPISASMPARLSYKP